MAQPGEQPVYYRAFQFMIEIDGIDRARFQECTGLEATNQVINVREGGDNLSVRKLPGLIEHSNVTLKRGYTDDDRLWTWFESAMNGRDIRKDMSIVQINMAGDEVFRWNLFRTFPAKYTGASYNATTNELAIETVEIAYERIERA